METTQVTLASRICLLCGRYESTTDNHVIYWLPTHMPHDTRCGGCGSHALVPEVKVFHPAPVEPAVDWLPAKIGRPTKAMLEERRKRQKGVYAHR